MAAALLIDFLSCWAFFIALGGFLDLLASDEFSARVASFIFRPTGQQARLSPAQLCSTFIDNTLIAYFGKNPFSIRALYCSAALSVAAVLITSLAMYVVSGHNGISAIVSTTAPTLARNPIFVVLGLIAILALDWLSFLQTFFFMRYAQRATSFVEITFIAYADIILSVNIFLFIFPCALVPLCLGFMEVGAVATETVGFFSINDDTATRLKVSLQTTDDPIVNVHLVDEKFDKYGSLGQILFSEPVAPPQAELDHPPDALAASDSMMAYRGGVFRYSGMYLADVPSFFLAHYKDLPDSEFTGVPATVLLKNYNYSQAYASTYKFKSDFDFGSPRQFIFGLSFLYASGFRSAQAIQNDAMDFLTLHYLEIPIAVTPFVIEFLVGRPLIPTWFLVDIDAKDWKYYIDICDDKVIISSVVNDRQCTRRLIFNSPYRVLYAIAMSSNISSKTLPLGIFFVSSFCVTLVFYLSLYIFLLGAYFIRAAAYVNPSQFNTFVNFDLARKHAVLIVFVVVGILPSAALAIGRTLSG